MLSIFRSQSENICENGVEIELKVQSTLPSDSIINNDGSKEQIKNMYLTTKMHDTLYKLNKNAEYLSKDFNQNDIVELFKTLSTIDNQSYYDIMCITSAIIAALDEKNYAVFSNRICDIITDENTKELPEPTADSDAESSDLLGDVGEEATQPKEDKDKMNVDESTNKKSKKKES